MTAGAHIIRGLLIHLPDPVAAGLGGSETAGLQLAAAGAPVMLVGLQDCTGRLGVPVPWITGS